MHKYTYIHICTFIYTYFFHILFDYGLCATKSDLVVYGLLFLYKEKAPFQTSICNLFIKFEGKYLPCFG